MRTSRKGLDLIANFEGFVDHPYNDLNGFAHIGFGHLLHESPVINADRVRWGRMSRDRALNLLAADAGLAESVVRQAVKVPLEQNQFDALVSFVFNCGKGSFLYSTLLRKLNRKDYDSVPGELMKWVRADGRTIPGLVTRRAAEAALFKGKPHSVLRADERYWIARLAHHRAARKRQRRGSREWLRRLRYARVYKRLLIRRAAGIARLARAEHNGWTRHHRAARRDIILRAVHAR